MTSCISIESPVGILGIEAKNGQLLRIQFDAEMTESCLPDEQDILLLDRAIEQLEEYFRGERREFDLPLAFHGTDFQVAVWRALQGIPFGETRSYADIARAIGNPKAVRAVGLANGKNPIPIVVPCHRVIGSDGSLTGFGGGIERKRQLLDLEAEKVFRISSADSL